MALFGRKLPQRIVPFGPSPYLLALLFVFFYYNLDFWQHHPEGHWGPEIIAGVFTVAVFLVMSLRDYLTGRRLEKSGVSPFR